MTTPVVITMNVQVDDATRSKVFAQLAGASCALFCATFSLDDSFSQQPHLLAFSRIVVHTQHNNTVDPSDCALGTRARRRQSEDICLSLHDPQEPVRSTNSDPSDIGPIRVACPRGNDASAVDRKMNCKALQTRAYFSSSMQSDDHMMQ